MQLPTTTNSLDAFLQQPNIEASPAWEFIHGQAQQKHKPTLFHSRLQHNLVNTIRPKLMKLFKNSGVSFLLYPPYQTLWL